MTQSPPSQGRRKDFLSGPAVIGTRAIFVMNFIKIITVSSDEKKVLGKYDVMNYDKSWISDNLPRLTE